MAETIRLKACPFCKSKYQKKVKGMVIAMIRNPQEYAKNLVVDYYNQHVEPTANKVLTFDEVYVVWYCYTLGNWKCLVSTTVPDGMYYEITHNASKNETYLDAYKKWEHDCIPDPED